MDSQVKEHASVAAGGVPTPYGHLPWDDIATLKSQAISRSGI